MDLMRRAILERDEMRRANVTPEDADRPLGQSVEYWQDRCLDHATALDDARQQLRGAVEALRAARIGHHWCHPSSQKNGDCQCGATKHNAAIDAALNRLGGQS